VLIGRFTSGKIADATDFHLCGRSLGRFQAGVSMAATIFSGSGLIGGAGLAYAIGVSGSYWNLTAVPAWVIIGLTMTVSLRKLGLNTIPQYIGQRYGVRTRRLIALLQIIEAIVFLAVQVLNSALALNALFNINFIFAAVLVTFVFVAYTAMGGLWAVVWTDIMQYFVLMSAVLAGVGLALWKVGGIAGLHAALPASHFSWSQLGTQVPLAWFALCIYSWGTDQAYLQRVFASKDHHVARFAYMFAAFNYLIFGLAVAGIGMAASALVPGLKDQDQAFPRLIANIFPHGLRGFFLTGILATTMSTASAYLAAPSSLFVQDIYEPLIGRQLDRKKLLGVSRISVVLLAAISLGVALRLPGVVDAVVFCTLVAPAAIFFPLLAALYWKRTNLASGFWAILTAAIAGCASQLWLWGNPSAGRLGEIHPLFFGPAFGVVVLAVASLWTKIPTADVVTAHAATESK
ncbi:MAG TPA: sodium:solute symporter family protein, partial [Candidatus Eremiobacteraceae bacterium]|nr:sodium:solute symporter family protein [Candidatus Eremiobacteraceae bacterium]